MNSILLNPNWLSRPFSAYSPRLTNPEPNYAKIDLTVLIFPIFFALWMLFVPIPYRHWVAFYFIFQHVSWHFQRQNVLLTFQTPDKDKKCFLSSFPTIYGNFMMKQMLGPTVVVFINYMAMHWLNLVHSVRTELRIGTIHFNCQWNLPNIRTNSCKLFSQLVHLFLFSFSPVQ